ncbi:MAG TPA: FAD-binding oxidoreductase [Hyphomicrobiaceae bacterium]|nr:FAD-binding oxidoreductase [Hyphomicrobiaceae bacterium]
MAGEFPTHARIVIVGAGAIGSSIAMHLAALGEREVVVLEKSGITHGSTWHAAGLVGQYRTRLDLTRLMQASVAVYDRLQQTIPIDWRPVGSLRLASSRARLDEFKAALPKARERGLDFRIVTPAEARDLFPLIDLDGVEGAAHVAGDGTIDPAAVGQGLATRARELGARILEGVLVTGYEMTGGRPSAVLTDRGRITCEHVVLAPGVWARAVGRMLGLDLPVAALRHQFAVTEAIPELAKGLPGLRDPDLNFYLKPEVGRFAIGGWEANTVPAFDGETPFEFGQELFPDEIDRLEPILAAAMRRLPMLARVGLKRIINGPIPFSPDGEPILGPAPGMPGVWLAVGFSAGIAAAGGAGKAMAEWIISGKPEFPLPSLDPGRFRGYPTDLGALNKAGVAIYGAYYALPAATS